MTAKSAEKKTGVGNLAWEHNLKETSQNGRRNRKATKWEDEKFLRRIK